MKTATPAGPTHEAETGIRRSRPGAAETAFCGVVIGGSAGGVDALTVILSRLPGDFPLPVLVVQHLHPSDDGAFAHHLGAETRLPVIEPSDKAPIAPGHVYTAPANYHMLVEPGDSIALSLDPRVRWSRPSIDVLFESAARAWGAGLIAVLLSGANDDGTRGLGAVRAAGGHTIAQDPSGARSPFMPRTAIDAGVADEVLGPAAIANRLKEFGIRQS